MGVPVVAVARSIATTGISPVGSSPEGSELPTTSAASGAADTTDWSSPAKVSLGPADSGAKSSNQSSVLSFNKIPSPSSGSPVGNGLGCYEPLSVSAGRDNVGSAGADEDVEGCSVCDSDDDTAGVELGTDGTGTPETGEAES